MITYNILRLYTSEFSKSPYSNYIKIVNNVSTLLWEGLYITDYLSQEYLNLVKNSKNSQVCDTKLTSESIYWILYIIIVIFYYIKCDFPARMHVRCC